MSFKLLLAFAAVALAFYLFGRLTRGAGDDGRGPMLQSGAPRPAITDVAVPADVGEQVKSLLRGGNKIEAIKVYREASGRGLKEAKDAVEGIERRM
ncbi:MAG: ribosomal protein L7/L12 [Pyrinomonadaceae bacterium]